jgi:hypothetical protein
MEARTGPLTCGDSQTRLEDRLDPTSRTHLFRSLVMFRRLSIPPDPLRRAQFPLTKRPRPFTLRVWRLFFGGGTVMKRGSSSVTRRRSKSSRTLTTSGCPRGSRRAMARSSPSTKNSATTTADSPAIGPGPNRGSATPRAVLLPTAVSATVSERVRLAARPALFFGRLPGAVRSEELVTLPGRHVNETVSTAVLPVRRLRDRRGGDHERF